MRTFTLRGRTFVLPDSMSVEAARALARAGRLSHEGNDALAYLQIETAMKLILGPDQWDTFNRLDPTLAELTALVNGSATHMTTEEPEVAQQPVQKYTRAQTITSLVVIGLAGYGFINLVGDIVRWVS